MSAANRGTLMTDTQSAPMGEQELIALAEAERIVDAYIDELSVDQSGHCRWADVADALTHIRGELRAAASPRLAGREEIVRIIDPVAFSGNEQQRHLHCSPLKVEVVQKCVRSKADAILSLLGPAPPTSHASQHRAGDEKDRSCATPPHSVLKPNNDVLKG